MSEIKLIPDDKLIAMVQKRYEEVESFGNTYIELYSKHSSEIDDDFSLKLSLERSQLELEHKLFDKLLEIENFIKLLMLAKINNKEIILSNDDMEFIEIISGPDC